MVSPGLMKMGTPTSMPVSSLGGLGDVGGGVAADAGRRVDDFEINGGRQFEFGDLAFDLGEAAAQVFGEIILGSRRGIPRSA
jgi:hypothetical protein